MTRSLRSALLGAALLLVPAAAAPSAQAASHSATASGGAVSATVTWQKTSRDGASKVHVSIARGGVEVTSDDPQPKCEAFCWEPIAEPPVNVQDLNADGEPEVLVDLYWGGAHCCWYTQVYRYLPATQGYRANVHVWGNFSYVPADLDHDGKQELVTRDNRFSYAFGSFADSRWPVRILTYRLGRLTVVTPRYVSEVARDANALWSSAMKKPRTVSNQGIVAAWAADEAMLGHSAAALRRIDRYSRRGRIHGERARVAFAARLRSFLRRTGYV
jgi:hypothetical protein